MARVRAKAVDLDRLRAALRRLDRGDLLSILDRALEHLSPAVQRSVVEGFLQSAEFTALPGGRRSLRTDVERFCAAAHRGDYYESFGVNSKNFMMKSAGTETFIAELDRLYKRCVRAAVARPDHATRDAFERLFHLEREVDDDPDAIVFFADEAGAWQLGTDWAEVLPAWFRCLAATAEPDEFAREVDRGIREHCEFDRARLLTAARSAASVAQKKALAALPRPKAR